MGEPGTVRIVGQVRASAGRSVSAVRFSVDGTLLGTVTDGPPYAVEWTDDNPFQRREIVVEAEDSGGDVGRDRIVLEPYVITELAEITSVLVEAGVYDKNGRMVKGLTASEFILEEDGVRQTPDMVAQETIPTTFALLVDGSHSMGRNMEFVRAAAARLTQYLRPKDHVLVAPFSRGLRAVTGPTNDRQTINEAVAAIEARGGTAMRDAMIEIWQADAEGRYWRPAAGGASDGDGAFFGFGRAGTDFANGLYWFESIKPGAVRQPNGRTLAPHVNVWIAARGINIGLHTRLYFSNESDANARDPLLCAIEPALRRKTLIAARRSEADRIIYRFDIVLQGDGETVFLDL